MLRLPHLLRIFVADLLASHRSRSLEDQSWAVATATSRVLVLLAMGARALSPSADSTRFQFSKVFGTIRWQGRPELRQVLPMLDDLASGCYYAGIGADGREYWLCSEEHVGQTVADGCCVGHEQSADFSAFYGQPVFVCICEPGNGCGAECRVAAR